MYNIIILHLNNSTADHDKRVDSVKLGKKKYRQKRILYRDLDSTHAINVCVGFNFFVVSSLEKQYPGFHVSITNSKTATFNNEMILMIKVRSSHFSRVMYMYNY